MTTPPILAALRSVENKGGFAAIVWDAFHGPPGLLKVKQLDALCQRLNLDCKTVKE